MITLIFTLKQLFKIVFQKCLNWAFLYYKILFPKWKAVSTDTYQKHFAVGVNTTNPGKKKNLTKIFWLADCLSQGILFFNSCLVEKVFSSETDAVAFCVGVTADTFSVVIMVVWLKQRSSFMLTVQLPLLHFLPAGLYCLWAASTFSHWEWAKSLALPFS